MSTLSLRTLTQSRQRISTLIPLESMLSYGQKALLIYSACLELTLLSSISNKWKGEKRVLCISTFFSVRKKKSNCLASKTKGKEKPFWDYLSSKRGHFHLGWILFLAVMRLESCLKMSQILRLWHRLRGGKLFCCHSDFSRVKSPTCKYQRRVAQKPEEQCLQGGIEISQEKIPLTLFNRSTLAPSVLCLWSAASVGTALSTGA